MDKILVDENGEVQAYDNSTQHWKFAKLVDKPTLVDTQTFTRYTKKNIITYLENPQKYQKELRQASIYMSAVSMQYNRLCSYYAKMPMWSYILSPITSDITALNPQDISTTYKNVVQTLDKMNLKHEFYRIAQTCFVEDTFFGVTWETKDSFYIQKINPTYCEICSMYDGVPNFTVDMSKIKEDALNCYPPEFTDMYQEYKNTGIKKQVVPIKISACFKVNDHLLYNLPPFAGVLPSLFDLEDYKALQKQRTEIGNYKALAMEIPTDKDGVPTLDWNIALQYYQQLVGVIPDYVGAVMSPMKISSFDFQKTGLTEADEVNNSEELIWRTAGTQSFLFGGGNRTTSSSLDLSIRCDEEIVFAFLAQCERWINRKLKLMSGKIKYKVSLLPVTIYNQQTKINQYTEAATYGIPTATALFATLGFTPMELEGLHYIENDILQIPTYTPLQSSHTQSGNQTQANEITESENEE